MHIVDIREIPGSAGRVTFTGATGRAWGVWHGALPPDGTAYVEVDLPEPVTTWRPAEPPDALTGAPQAELTVCAVVESVDDGVVALRLASDVLLVDWGGAAVPVPGERIRFAVLRAELYPYAL